MNSIQTHSQSRQEFFNNLKDYNWNLDTKKLKAVREMGANIPKEVRYKEPNFVQVKNAINRCDYLIKNRVQYERYEEAEVIKKSKQEI